MQVPIIPVAIHGTFEAMPKTGIAIRPGKCKLELLAPIAPPMNPSDERSAAETLALDTKKAIEAALGSRCMCVIVVHDRKNKKKLWAHLPLVII